jgi:hypothetical protein
MASHLEKHEILFQELIDEILDFAWASTTII